MVNLHFKCRPITKIKELIDEFNYWNWEDKDRVKFRKDMLVEFKFEDHSVIGS
jgi:hypothetical protein